MKSNFRKALKRVCYVLTSKGITKEITTMTVIVTHKIDMSLENGLGFRQNFRQLKNLKQFSLSIVNQFKSYKANIIKK